MSIARVAVIDIGKTNAKLALVDLARLEEIAVVTRPNTVLPGPPWPHFDVEGHWAFVLEGLARFHAEQGVDAIAVTTHGASCALLDAQGGLAAPILDYEHDGPDAVAAEYDALRPGFDETGSSRLPQGLNVGAQLHWMLGEMPGLRERVATVLTYPQYWAHRLTGVAASDVTSLGCHTDLWSPTTGRFTELPQRLGLGGKMAAPRRPGELLGRVLPQVARATGLPQDTPVVTGIHDSNASLYPHIRAHSAPFSTVSTGTWVVVMAVGSRSEALDPARDTLLNVSAEGQPVPSARFMGGREFEIVRDGADTEATPQAAARVLDTGIMLLPSVVPGTGPYPGRTMAWIGTEPAVGSAERSAALAFYLALMTATCLRLAGHRGDIFVEGPFTQNGSYLDMLAAVTDDRVLKMRSSTGTSIGAALLFSDDAPDLRPSLHAATANAAALRSYASRWQAEVDQV
ncbi:FGGY-family carbohydrate kinase [Algicella marina]|uniref:Carbohydrate kinase n=1 Tax=Algicella marina TaxID=2683284 RepID=A0A6P1T283_9RHOB|nr:FGGY-family carbohydrate kinase [Algicella marina]QHQ35910.1 carbohydrate kinase [Algicella marina]